MNNIFLFTFNNAINNVNISIWKYFTVEKKCIYVGMQNKMGTIIHFIIRGESIKKFYVFFQKIEQQ